MYTLGAGRILIKSIIIVCLLNLMAWKDSWAHRTGENEKKNDKIKKSVQTSSACDRCVRATVSKYFALYTTERCGQIFACSVFISAQNSLSVKRQK